MADVTARDRVRMTPGEIDQFLGSHSKVQVAVNGHDGTPHLTTLFYVLDDEGRICFWTYASSQKVKNLERDDRISGLVEDGEAYAELRGVSLRGRAEVVRDADRLRVIGSGVVCRMTGVNHVDELGAVGRDEVERQIRKRVGVVLHPDRVASWDHSKLA